jgi:hypothetical protein
MRERIITPWHRLRRALKRLLRRAAPASFALTPAQARTIFADAGIEPIGTHAVLPLLSESRIFVARRAEALNRQHDAPSFPLRKVMCEIQGFLS